MSGTPPGETFDDIKTQRNRRRRAGAGHDPIRLPDGRNAILGNKFKVISGYESTPKSISRWSAAKCRATGHDYSTLKALKRPWITDKKVKIFAQWGL